MLSGEGRRMKENQIESQFSANRLGGEPIPKDIRILLAHADDLIEQTGIALNWEAGWAPWLDTSYLSEAERANPDIAANVRAIAEVCGLIAFVAANEDDEYFGYWRGPNQRMIADSPLVYLDNEGQFNLCGGSTFAEAVLGQTYDEEQFTELRDWLRSIGIAIRHETSKDLVYPEASPSPDELHKELYYRYRREAGLS
jgi:hypothetical protein